MKISSLSDSRDNVSPFESDDIIIHVLSFVNGSLELMNCRLVNQQYKKHVDLIYRQKISKISKWWRRHRKYWRAVLKYPVYRTINEGTFQDQGYIIHGIDDLDSFTFSFLARDCFVISLLIVGSDISRIYFCQSGNIEFDVKLSLPKDSVTCKLNDRLFLRCDSQIVFARVYANTVKSIRLLIHHCDLF